MRPICLQLTRAIAKTVLLWWDDNFLELTKNIDIAMNQRCIDDTNLVYEVIDAGWESSQDTNT